MNRVATAVLVVLLMVAGEAVADFEAGVLQLYRNAALDGLRV